MKLKDRTPKTDMHRGAIIGTMGEIDRDALSEELGVTVDSVNVELSRYSYISARVEFGKGEVDFELALPKDSAETIRSKFLAYLDSNCMASILAARDGLSEMDTPFYAALAPNPPEEKN